MKFLYPFGATLNVVQPSVVALSSGSIAIPMNRPICAYHCVKNGGKLVVLGSSRMLTDTYIEKENNDSLREMIFDFFELNFTETMDFHTDDIEVSLHLFVTTYTLQHCLYKTAIFYARSFGNTILYLI